MLLSKKQQQNGTPNPSSQLSASTCNNGDVVDGHNHGRGRHTTNNNNNKKKNHFNAIAITMVLVGFTTRQLYQGGRIAEIQKAFVTADDHEQESSLPRVSPDIAAVLPGGGGEHDPLRCQFSAKLRKTECCAPWEVDGDKWWLHHPDWEVSTENETSYCFAPLEHDSPKAVFLRKLHRFQWSNNCSNVEKSCEVNSGFAASTTWLVNAFWYAYRKKKRPFQIMNNGRRWLYATSDNSSWAYCKEQDSRCYYLPFSPCSREVPEGMDRNHHDTGTWKSAAPRNNKQRLKYHWMARYLQRPRQHFRRKSFELRQSLNVSYPCLAMHVRRGDVGRGRHPFRRFAHVQEYLDKARAKKGDNIVLLTDAESTILEVKARHRSQYNWIYLDRPRHKVGSSVRFDDHFPSGDPGTEMLAIKVESEVASSCQKVVHGQSGFVENMLRDTKNDGKKYTEYQVKTKISNKQAKRFKYVEFELDATKPIPRKSKAVFFSFFVQLLPAALLRVPGNETSSQRKTQK